MVSLINKQLLLTAYAYLFIMEQQKVQQGSEALQLQVEESAQIAAAWKYKGTNIVMCDIHVDASKDDYCLVKVDEGNQKQGDICARKKVGAGQLSKFEAKYNHGKFSTLGALVKELETPVNQVPKIDGSLVSDAWKSGRVVLTPGNKVAVYHLGGTLPVDGYMLCSTAQASQGIITSSSPSLETPSGKIIADLKTIIERQRRTNYTKGIAGPVAYFDVEKDMYGEPGYLEKGKDGEAVIVGTDDEWTTFFSGKQQGNKDRLDPDSEDWDVYIVTGSFQGGIITYDHTDVVFERAHKQRETWWVGFGARGSFVLSSYGGRMCPAYKVIKVTPKNMRLSYNKLEEIFGVWARGGQGAPGYGWKNDKRDSFGPDEVKLPVRYNVFTNNCHTAASHLLRRVLSTGFGVEQPTAKQLAHGLILADKLPNTLGRTFACKKRAIRKAPSADEGSTSNRK